MKSPYLSSILFAIVVPCFGCQGSASPTPATSRAIATGTSTGNSSLPASAMTQYKVLEVSFFAKQEANPPRYPLPVEEEIRLNASAELQYSAYFFNMPIQFNHNDRVSWQAGNTGKETLSALSAMVNDDDGMALLQPLLSDDECADAHFTITLVDDATVESRYCVPATSGALSENFAAAFQAMRSAFEEATGRPLDPYSLPK